MSTFIKQNIHCVKGLSQIVPGDRAASTNYYLSHLILLAVRATGLICESPLTQCIFCFINVDIRHLYVILT